jgi:hypothetical protein
MSAKVSQKQVNYVLTELAGYAKLADPDSGIEVNPLRTFQVHLMAVLSTQSGILIVSFRTKLPTICALQSPNSRVLDELKDWHPGSNGQVLDLVHPSLYPIIYDAPVRPTRPL